MKRERLGFKNSKRIAIVIDSMDGGGAERVSLDLSRYFVEAGYKVDLVLCIFRGSLLKQIPKEVRLFVIEGNQKSQIHSIECSIPKDEVNWVIPNEPMRYSDFIQHIVLTWPFGFSVIPSKRGRRSRWAHAFSVYVERRSPDITIAILKYAIYSTLVGRELSENSMPIICSIRSALSTSSRYGRAVHKNLLHKADWVHTVSEGIQNELSELEWVEKSKVTTIHNSVNRERILNLVNQKSGHPWVDKGSRKDHKVILSVGRMQQQKNYSLLLRAFANVARTERIKLIILGEGGG